MKTPRSQTGYCNARKTHLADNALFLIGFFSGTLRAAVGSSLCIPVPSMRSATPLLLALTLAAPSAMAQGMPTTDPPAAAKPAASNATTPAEPERKRRLRFRDDKASCAPGSLGEADIQSIVTNKSGTPATPKGTEK